MIIINLCDRLYSPIDCFAINTEKYSKEMEGGGISFIRDAFPTFRIFSVPLEVWRCYRENVTTRFVFQYRLTFFPVPCPFRLATMATMPRKWRLPPWKFPFQGTTNVVKSRHKLRPRDTRSSSSPRPPRPIVCDIRSIQLIFGKRVVRGDRACIEPRFHT